MSNWQKAVNAMDEKVQQKSNTHTNKHVLVYVVWCMFIWDIGDYVIERTYYNNIELVF